MSFQRLIRVGSFLFLLLSLSSAADAQRRRGNEGGWELLGRSYVNARGDPVEPRFQGELSRLTIEQSQKQRRIARALATRGRELREDVSPGNMKQLIPDCGLT